MRLHMQGNRSKCGWRAIEFKTFSVIEPALRCGETKAQGFGLTIVIKVEILEKEFIVYDALYAYCRDQVSREPTS